MKSLRIFQQAKVIELVDSIREAGCRTKVLSTYVFSEGIIEDSHEANKAHRWNELLHSGIEHSERLPSVSVVVARRFEAVILIEELGQCEFDFRNKYEVLLVT